jgi:DNA (cytosine-5)-methyltransferase 1
MKGMSKKDWKSGQSTRSGLLWEVERILNELSDDELPQVLLMENVPQVHAEQNAEDFESWLAFLRGRGYNNFYKDLNARDFGIPQNRDRCFCISYLSKDFIEYDFPEAIPLTTVMRDYLEPHVDEKYYINTPKAAELIDKLIDTGVLEADSKEVADARS